MIKEVERSRLVEMASIMVEEAKRVVCVLSQCLQLYLPSKWFHNGPALHSQLVACRMVERVAVEFIRNVKRRSRLSNDIMWWAVDGQ